MQVIYMEKRIQHMYTCTDVYMIIYLFSVVYVMYMEEENPAHVHMYSCIHDYLPFSIVYVLYMEEKNPAHVHMYSCK